MPRMADTTMRGWFGRVGAAGAALLLVLSVGCSSGDDDDDDSVAAMDESGGAAGEGDGAAAEDGDDTVTEEEMVDYTECLREQGVEVEDPQVDAEGNVQFGGFGDDIQPGSDEFDAMLDELREAQEACGEPPGGGFAGRSGQDQAEMQDQMLEFAQCMRDHGVDVPDPDFSGGQPSFGDSGIDRNDPEVQAAMDECQDLLAGIGSGGE
jgi:hypothetical protein